MENNFEYSYPHNDEYEYETILEQIDLDKEREYDLTHDNGFIIAKPNAKSNKKNVKDPNGIFSNKYGQTLGDLNPFMDRYKCECGNLKSRIHHGLVCKLCKTRVKFVDDNFGYFGWRVMNEPYTFIHPNIYEQIKFFLGVGHGKVPKLENILKIIDIKDKDGHSTEERPDIKDEPWYGAGAEAFKENFDEIMKFYLKKSPNKKDYYIHIMNNREKVFTHSLPIFTTALRPLDIKDGQMHYMDINKYYSIMNHLTARINDVSTRFSRSKKPKNQLMYDFQMKYADLYSEITAILSGKKGQIRTLMGGRYSFSSRSVVVQNPELRIDQVTMPYKALVVLLEQRIINILHRTYNISSQEAWDIWYRANITPDERVKEIITSIIRSYPNGIPVIINRNPTIAYGGILQMFVVGMTDSYTLGIPLQILPLLAADFDGDTFNIFLIINEAFFRRANEIFNPRNAMYISRIDGCFNLQVCWQRDALINANTFTRLGRDHLSEAQHNRLKARAIRNRERLITGY